MEDAHEFLMRNCKKYKKQQKELMKMRKKDKAYMPSRKYKHLSNKSKGYFRRKMKKMLAKRVRKGKKWSSIGDKRATKLKKSLSSGFKDADMRELKTSVSSEKKQKYFSTWIGKVQHICNGEIPTSKLFTNWEKSGKINKLKDKRVDLALCNALSTYIEHNTYK